MNIKAFLSKLFTKKILAVCVLVLLIPQVIQLIIRLTWTIAIVLVFFLIFELCIVVAVKAWFPDRVNVAHVAEWTIATLLRFGNIIFNVICNILYSCFDLVFGKVFQSGNGQRARKPQR